MHESQRFAGYFVHVRVFHLPKIFLHNVRQYMDKVKRRKRNKLFSIIREERTMGNSRRNTAFWDDMIIVFDSMKIRAGDYGLEKR